MVLMALDHVRDFVHRAAMTASPTDLATTTPAIFLTRWVTHICAPVFMFTAGLGAYLWWQRGATRQQLSRFLVTRGLWLVGLELTVMRLAYNFNLSQTYPVLLHRSLGARALHDLPGSARVAAHPGTGPRERRRHRAAQLPGFADGRTGRSGARDCGT